MGKTTPAEVENQKPQHPTTLSQRFAQLSWGETTVLMLALGVALLGPNIAPWARVVLLIAGGTITLMLARRRLLKNALWQERWSRRDLRKTLAAQEPRLKELEARLQKHLLGQAEELAQAKDIQQSFLPTAELSTHGDLRFAFYYRPSVSVGGDLYDVIRLSENYAAFYMADAAGHGVGAALMSVMLKFNLERHLDALKIAAQEESLTEEVLQDFVAQLNNQLERTLQGGRFVSFLLATVHVGTGEVLIVNCGHNQPIFTRGAEATVEEFEVSPNIVLGIVPGMEFTANKTQLAPGEKMILYTDGLTERTNSAGREWGIHNLLHTVRENAESDPESLVRQIMLGNKTYCGSKEAEDDIAILAMERVRS